MCVLGFSARGDEGKGCPLAESPQPPRDPQPKTQHRHSRQEKKRKKKSPPPSGGENTFFIFSPDSPVCQAVAAAHCIDEVDCLKSAQAAEQPAAAERGALGACWLLGGGSPHDVGRCTRRHRAASNRGTEGEKLRAGGLRACPQPPPPSKRPPETAPRERD